MNKLIVFLQAQSYEDLGLKSALVLVVISLAGAIVYLYKSKESAISDKNKEISEVLKERLVDIKAYAEKEHQMIERYHQFLELIKKD